MRLKVCLPDRILLDEAVEKVVAEAVNGSFCLLPRHTDFVSALVPGLLAYTLPDGGERYLAVDEGVLVKTDADVLLSTRQAASGGDLGHLRETIEREFAVRDEKEQAARSAIAKLEADFVRRFLDLGERRG